MSKRPGRHRNIHVVSARIASKQIDTAHADALEAVLDYDRQHQGYLLPETGGGRIRMQTSPRIAEARSQVVDEFFKHFPKAEALWWTDSDATYDENVLEALMDVFHVEQRPIVGALAFAGTRADNIYPTMYGAKRDDDGELDIWQEDDYPRDALVKVAGTGCHCIVVARHVFKAMAVAYAKLPNGRPNPYPWYAEGHVDRNGRPIGEDMIFCIRAAALDFPTYVHTGIKTGHVKQIILDEPLWDRRPKPAPTLVLEPTG